MPEDIEEFVNASSSKSKFGSVKADILRIGPKKTAKGFHIEEYVIGDATGSITLVLFDHKEEYDVGDTLHINQCYSKMFKQVNQLQMTRKGSISKNGQTLVQLNNTAVSAPIIKKPTLSKDAIIAQIMSNTGLSEDEVNEKIAVKLDEFKILGNAINENEIAEIIAKLEKVELVYPKIPVVDSYDGSVLRDTPLVDMTDDELREAFKASRKGAARGLIDKELMARRDNEVLRDISVSLSKFGGTVEVIEDKPKPKKKVSKKKTIKKDEE